jgi:hypothetical protein
MTASPKSWICDTTRKKHTKAQKIHTGLAEKKSFYRPVTNTGYNSRGVCKRREHLRTSKSQINPHANIHEHSRTPNRSQIYIQTASSYRTMHRTRNFQKTRTPKNKANSHTNSHQYSRTPKQVRKCCPLIPSTVKRHKPKI